MIIWIQKAMSFAALVMLAALGELLTERSGSLNLGTPGTLCVGASVGFLSAFNYCNAVEAANPLMLILLTLGTSFLAGLLMGLIFAFFTVSLRINQNVVGLVMTIFGTGLAEFLSVFFVKSTTGNVRCDPAYNLFTAKIPFLSDKLGIVSDLFFNYGFMFYVTIALSVVMMLVFKRTRIGLNLRAVGENPGTADAAGVSVTKYRYAAVMLGSGLSGMAGIFCVLEFKSGAWSTSDIVTIEAFGWLAVALVIFALWRPLNLLWGSLIFGVCYWAYLYLPPLLGIKMSDDLTQMLPYIITIVVLVIVSFRKNKDNQGPAALGMSYFREER